MLIFSALVFHIGHTGQLNHGFGFLKSVLSFSVNVVLPHYENAWQMKNNAQSIAAISFPISLLCHKVSQMEAIIFHFPHISILWYFLTVVPEVETFKLTN